MRHIQFSKKIVTAVLICVTVLCTWGMGLCAYMESPTGLVDIARGYLSFATLCFAAYSGNSAVEKWLTHRYDPEING